jgi:hypothetical protein
MATLSFAASASVLVMLVVAMVNSPFRHNSFDEFRFDVWLCQHLSPLSILLIYEVVEYETLRPMLWLATILSMH